MPKLPVAILIAVCAVFASAADQRRPESGDTKASSGVTLKDATAIVRQAYGGARAVGGVGGATHRERQAGTGLPASGRCGRYREDRVRGSPRTYSRDREYGALASCGC